MIDGDITRNILVCGPDDPRARDAGARLAESLRGYRMPRGSEKATEDAAKPIIQEDYEEAPLGDSIRERMAGSGLLVVICVPASKNSEAISERLEYFSRELGREDKIIAVLAEGEPAESFPPYFMQTRTIRETLPDGSVREITETIEPVAADLRGQTGRDRKRALAYETVRVSAAMAGIHPDILERRHEKRRKKRLITLLAISGSIFIAVAVIFSWLGLIAVREGQVAERQTEIGSEMVDRLFVELPKVFEEEPQALEYVDNAILAGIDALLAAGSANAGLVDLDTVLVVSERDGANSIIRKASMWRRSGEWDRAMELYRQGLLAAGSSAEAHTDLFLQRMETIKGYPKASAGYALYILSNNSSAPLNSGDLIIDIDGKPLTGFGDYGALLYEAMPGAAFNVTVLHADEGTASLMTLELKISIDQLRALAVVQV